MAYDLVIRNGRVVDGSGGAPYPADIGIVGDRIACVGRIRESGAEEIDAEGHAVTPGFVDGHIHLDAQICWDPLGTSACWHGVTSVVMGNCGFTIAPGRAEEAHLALRSLERAEKMAVDLGPGLRPAPWSQRNAILGEATLLVNTTSLGMVGQPALDLDLSLLPESAVVNDLVYSPLITALLSAARARGNIIVDGLGMLLHQARPGFKAWFGTEPTVTAELRDFVAGT